MCVVECETAEKAFGILVMKRDYGPALLYKMAYVIVLCLKLPLRYCFISVFSAHSNRVKLKSNPFILSDRMVRQFVNFDPEIGNRVQLE